MKFMTLPKILVGERCNIEGMNGDLLQNIVFNVFPQSLD